MEKRTTARGGLARLQVRLPNRRNTPGRTLTTTRVLKCLPTARILLLFLFINKNRKSPLHNTISGRHDIHDITFESAAAAGEYYVLFIYFGQVIVFFFFAIIYLYYMRNRANIMRRQIYLATAIVIQRLRHVIIIPHCARSIIILIIYLPLPAFDREFNIQLLDSTCAVTIIINVLVKSI